MEIHVYTEVVRTMTLEEFADIHGLHMKVVERSPSHPGTLGLYRYYCCFEGEGAIIDGGVLVFVTGNGDSIEDAICDYASRISKKMLILNPYGAKDRREIQVPQLTYTVKQA